MNKRDLLKQQTVKPKPPRNGYIKSIAEAIHIILALFGIAVFILINILKGDDR